MMNCLRGVLRSSRNQWEGGKGQGGRGRGMNQSKQWWMRRKVGMGKAEGQGAGRVDCGIQ